MRGRAGTEADTKADKEEAGAMVGVEEVDIVEEAEADTEGGAGSVDIELSSDREEQPL